MQTSAHNAVKKGSTAQKILDQYVAPLVLSTVGKTVILVVYFIVFAGACYKITHSTVFFSDLIFI